MPPFVPVTDVASVTVNGSQAGHPAQFGLDCLHDGAITSITIDDLLTIFDTWIAESLLPVMCEGSTINNIQARDLTSEDSYDQTSIVETDGTNPTACEPAQVAVVLTKRTSLSGRSRRGRMYLFGVPEAYQQDERHITAAAVAAYNEVGSSLMTAFVGTEWTPVVVSYIDDGAPRVTPLVTPLTALECRDSRYDTQRRRLGRS
jgi:hypothetical protein